MTNKTNLDKTYIDLLSKDWHVTEDTNRYSVTKLLSNIRESVILEKNPPSNEDAADSFQAFLGNCVHEWLQNHIKGGENEKKIEIKIDDVHTVVGVIDRLENHKIIDYKVRKSTDSNFENAIKQIKIYAYLLREKGVFVEKGEVHVFKKDWSKMKNSDKPPIEIIEFDIDSFDIEWAKEFVFRKINEFEKARKNLPLCSDIEKWKQNDLWAVYSKEENLKAKKVFTNETDAKNYAKQKMKIVLREGKCIKCENFCKVRNICKRLTEV